MPALQVRDLPQDLYDKLKYRAEREHRSLAQQTIVAIEEHLGGEGLPAASNANGLRLINSEAERKARIERRRQVFERIDKLPHFEQPEDFPSIVELIHEGREVNDGRLGC